MIVAKLETFVLRIPFTSDNGAAASAWGDSGLPAADSLLVRVTTDQGLEGWGEAFGFRAVRSAKLAIDELIAPVCIATPGFGAYRSTTKCIAASVKTCSFTL
jgi:L-alanine-DL-glutamate epimerase-like enolase superfamily enzyme